MKQKTPPLGKDVFAFAFENKRYHTLAYENRLRGYKLHKAVIDAGFTCPNLDGTRGTGGCIFCSGGSGYFTAPAALSIEAQLARELERLRRRDPRARAAAYFQAHTNTYAPAAVLRVKYGMSHATVQRLQADLPVSTHTLNKLCAILECPLDAVAEYIPDDPRD